MNGFFKKIGFSLIEVMVALVLFSLSIALLTNSYMNAVLAKENNKNSQNENAFIAWAKDFITTIEDKDKLLQGGELTLPSNEQIQWSAEINETENLDLFSLMIQIEKGENEPIKSALRFYLLRPEWSESEERKQLLEKKKTYIESLQQNYF